MSSDRCLLLSFHADPYPLFPPATLAPDQKGSKTETVRSVTIRQVLRDNSDSSSDVYSVDGIELHLVRAPGTLAKDVRLNFHRILQLCYAGALCTCSSAVDPRGQERVPARFEFRLHHLRVARRHRPDRSHGVLQ